MADQKSPIELVIAPGCSGIDSVCPATPTNFHPAQEQLDWLLPDEEGKFKDPIAEARVLLEAQFAFDEIAGAPGCVLEFWRVTRDPLDRSKDIGRYEVDSNGIVSWVTSEKRLVVGVVVLRSPPGKLREAEAASPGSS